MWKNLTVWKVAKQINFIQAKNPDTWNGHMSQQFGKHRSSLASATTLEMDLGSDDRHDCSAP